MSVIASEIRWINRTLASWSAYDPAVKCELSSHALSNGGEMVVIDPIGLADAGFSELFSMAEPVAILLTNGNHWRATVEWRERLGVPVFAPREGMLELGGVADVWLDEGDEAPGGLQVLGMQSAGPGEVAYVSESFACVGDALIHLLPWGFSMLPSKYCANAGRLPNDLRKLLSYELCTMIFAHGKPLLRDVRKRLERLLK